MTDVEVGVPAPIGDAIIDNKPGLLLIVEKQPESNTLELTRQVEAAIESLRPGLAGVAMDPTIFRPATFIERAIDNLRRALVVGCGLVVVILLAFLFDWRTALISLTAIPLSLTAAVLLVTLAGASINTMVLAGLVIAFGEVVDDAIIDVENVARRLRLNAAAGNPHSAFRVVVGASLEVRSAVVYASVIVVLVFIPVFFLDGLSGAFFRPLATAYVLAIAASLLVALTVTPALAYLLLTGRKGERPEAPLTRLLKRAYDKVLPACVARPRTAVGILVGAFILTGAATTRLGQEFLPDFQETDFLMHFVEKPGTSLDAMRPGDRTGQPGLDGHAGGPQLRLAHRPGRSRRRSGRPELHGTVDQHRPQGRLQADHRQDPEGRRAAIRACIATCSRTCASASRKC